METILIYIACTAVFAALYAIKGGSGYRFFPNWNYVREKNRVYDRLLDGKVITPLLACLFFYIATGDFGHAVLFAGAWLLAVAPSMGEEHGAIGRFDFEELGRHDTLIDKIKHSTTALGGYLRKDQTHRGRFYDVKKGLQRGVWMGAFMTLATGFIPYICFSFLFVPCVFVGQEIGYRITGKDGWALSELIIGAVLFGLPTAIMLS